MDKLYGWSWIMKWSSLLNKHIYSRKLLIFHCGDKRKSFAFHSATKLVWKRKIHFSWENLDLINSIADWTFPCFKHKSKSWWIHWNCLLQTLKSNLFSDWKRNFSNFNCQFAHILMACSDDLQNRIRFFFLEEISFVNWKIVQYNLCPFHTLLFHFRYFFSL